MTNCLFFGDSITYGEYDGILGGYVEILKRYAHSKFYNEQVNEVNCFNLGIGGETTFGLIKRFETEIKARLSMEENLIFFLYGANDLAKKDGVDLVSLADFKMNLTHAIEKAKLFSHNIYLISILPVASSVDGIFVPERKFRDSFTIDMYNEAVKEIALENEVIYLDVHSEFKKNRDHFISKDGVHPNEIGYQFIADYIKPIIESYF